MTAAGPLDAAYIAAASRGDHDQAKLLEQALEATRDVPPTVTPAEAAAWYASIGLPTFPLQPGRKIPYSGSHGVKDATTDTSQLAQWFTVAPESNVGVATGDRFDVIDIDGDEGAATFARMVRDDPNGAAWLIVQAVSQTPRGLHLWVPAVPGATNGGAEYDIHVDYRAKGGYVVAPPSHVDGTLYRWLLPPA